MVNYMCQQCNWDIVWCTFIVHSRQPVWSISCFFDQLTQLLGYRHSVANDRQKNKFYVGLYKCSVTLAKTVQKFYFYKEIVM